MVAGKKRPTTHITGESGVSIFKKYIPKEWVVREYTPDYGIDLSVELFEAMEDGYITKGEHVFFQIKCTESINRSTEVISSRYNVEKKYEQTNQETVEMEVIKFVLDTDLLATVEAMGSAVPVILAVVDMTTEDIYFLCLNDYVEKVLVPDDSNYMNKSSKTIKIPAQNKLNCDRGIWAIEWYAKRAKLFALFNKIHYQEKELRYCLPHEIEERIHHFLAVLLRSDAWSASKYFYVMKSAKAEIEYYLQHGITEDAERIIKRMEEQGEDVDTEKWESSIIPGVMSFREIQKRQSLLELWNKLANMGDILEDISKEWYMPTYMGVLCS